MRHYTHLSIEEREKLYLRRGQGAKLREIARELGRSVSTMSRELKRNERPRHPYSPSQAQKRYEKRRKACGRKHILCEAFSTNWQAGENISRRPERLFQTLMLPPACFLPMGVAFNTPQSRRLRT